MEAQAPFELILACTSGLDRSRVRARVDSEAASLWRPLQEEIAGRIERLWADRCAANPRLFNATKFRLIRAAGDDGQAELSVGLTDYRSYLGTNQADDHEEVVRKYGSEALSNPLGTATFVITCDSHFILQRRSAHVGECVRRAFLFHC